MGAHLKKLRRAEGGANIFGVFRVKNLDLPLDMIDALIKRVSVTYKYYEM
jgi:hypothetical protein